MSRDALGILLIVLFCIAVYLTHKNPPPPAVPV